MLIRSSTYQNTNIPTSLCSGPTTKFSHLKSVHVHEYKFSQQTMYNPFDFPLYCEYLHAENNKSSKYKQVVTLELFNVTDHSLGNWCHWLGNFEFVEVEEFCPWFHSFPGLCDPFSGIYIGKWYRHPLNK